MTIYICLLRGINVSGHHKIKMNTLREMITQLNFTNVQTYIQSGNIVFQSKIQNIKILENKIAKSIENYFGFIIPVIVINLNTFKLLVNNNPFLQNKKIDTKYLHYTFISENTLNKNTQNIYNFKFPPDEVIIVEKAIYLYCPNGYGKTKWNNLFFEKKFQVNATTRNWKTTNELIAIAENIIHVANS